MIREISERHSIRDYLTNPVEPEKLQRVLQAGQKAPTAKNNQDWLIIIVDQPQLKRRLIDASTPKQTFLQQAPIILVACALKPDYIMRCGHPAFLIDLAIVLDHISLQAVHEGLGTCWIGSFDEAKAKKTLKIPAPIRIVELMSLGYPRSIPQPTTRKILQELFQWNHL